MAKKLSSAPNTGQFWNGNGNSATTPIGITSTPRVTRRMLERAKLIGTIEELEDKYPLPRPRAVKDRLRALRAKAAK